MEDKNIFYCNENILANEDIKYHYKKSNNEYLFRSGCEFVCIKGSNPKFEHPRKPDADDIRLHQ